MVFGGLYLMQAAVLRILLLHIGLQAGQVAFVVVGNTGAGHGKGCPVGHRASGGEGILRQQGLVVGYAPFRPLGDGDIHG